MEPRNGQPRREKGDALLHGRVSLALERGNRRQPIPSRFGKDLGNGAAYRPLSRRTSKTSWQAAKWKNIFENTRFCPHAQSGAGRPGYPCKAAQHFPTADEVRYPHRSGRGAYLLRQRGTALYRPFPERYRALPRNDDEAGGSGRRMKTDVIIKQGRTLRPTGVCPMKASIVALPARPIMPCGTTGLTRRSDARTRRSSTLIGLSPYIP